MRGLACLPLGFMGLIVAGSHCGGSDFQLGADASIDGAGASGGGSGGTSSGMGASSGGRGGSSGGSASGAGSGGASSTGGGGSGSGAGSSGGGSGSSGVGGSGTSSGGSGSSGSHGSSASSGGAGSSGTGSSGTGSSGAGSSGTGSSGTGSSGASSSGSADAGRGDGGDDAGSCDCAQNAGCCTSSQICCPSTVLGGPSRCLPKGDADKCPIIISDRNLKRDIEPVDARAVLETVASLPISTWAYRSDRPSVRHMGPMAQDFQAAFGLGDSDRSYDAVDAHGVTLAAIKALYERVQEQNARIERLERENEQLRGYSPQPSCTPSDRSSP